MIPLPQHPLAFLALPIALGVIARGNGYTPPHGGRFGPGRTMRQADTTDLPPPQTHPGGPRLSCLDRTQRDAAIEDALHLAKARGMRKRIKIEMGILIALLALLSAAFIGFSIYIAIYGFIGIGAQMTR